MNRLRSFTLLELLTVLAIIGTLSTIAFSSYQNAKVRARDTRRKADLQSLKVATVLYKQAGSTYPIVATQAAACTTSGGAGQNLAGWQQLQTSLASYISTLALDPLSGQNAAGNCPAVNFPWLIFPGTNRAYAYTASGTGTSYSFWASLENQSDADHNGLSAHNDATATLGKYKNLYYYSSIVTATNTVAAQNDNAANLYGVGCRIVGANCLDN